MGRKESGMPQSNPWEAEMIDMEKTLKQVGPHSRAAEVQKQVGTVKRNQKV